MCNILNCLDAFGALVAIFLISFVGDANADADTSKGMVSTKKKQTSKKLSKSKFKGGDSLEPEKDYSILENHDETRLGQCISDHLNETFKCDTGFTFDGKGIFLTTVAKQDEDTGLDNITFVYDGELNIHFLKRTNSLGIGLESCIKTRSGLIKGDRAIFDSLYAYVEDDKLGRFIAGWAGTAADSFTIGGNSICVAYGGPDSGNLNSFYNPAAGTITGTGCPVDDGKALKIGWFSHTLKGVSLGMTFTFDSKYSAPFKKKHCSENCSPAKGGQHVCWDYAHSSGYSKHIFTSAIRYEYGDENGFNTKVAAGGWFGKAKAGAETKIKGGVHDVRAWFVGTILGYKDLKIALGYIDSGRSIVDKYRAQDIDLKYSDFDTKKFDTNTAGVGLLKGADAGKIFTCGLSYNLGCLTTYTGYFRSIVKYSDKSFEKAKTDILTLGAEYKINNVWSVFAEYNNMRTKTCDRARIYAKVCEQGDGGKNKGNLYMIGSKIFF